MSIPKRHRLVLLILTLMLSTASAIAGNVAFVFTVDWQRGALFGSSAQGSLSFDQSLVLPNAQYLGPSSLSAFSFTAGTHTYGLADVTTGFLSFDENANLRLLGVGTHCGPGFCAVGNDPDSMYIAYDSQSRLDRFTAVIGPADALQSYGVGQLQIAPIPEPASFAIMLAGLGSFALWRRARPGSALS